MAITLIVEQAAQQATDTNQIDQFKRLCREEAEVFMRWANNHPAVGNDPEGAEKLRLCYLDLGGLSEPVRSMPAEIPSHTPSTAEEIDWPWCEACKSYHHPNNPTCFKKRPPAHLWLPLLAQIEAIDFVNLDGAEKVEWAAVVAHAAKLREALK